MGPMDYHQDQGGAHGAGGEEGARPGHQKGCVGVLYSGLEGVLRDAQLWRGGREGDASCCREGGGAGCRFGEAPGPSRMRYGRVGHKVAWSLGSSRNKAHREVRGGGVRLRRQRGVGYAALRY